jgi:hypothetical protein
MRDLIDRSDFPSAGMSSVLRTSAVDTVRTLPLNENQLAETTPENPDSFFLNCSTSQTMNYKTPSAFLGFIQSQKCSHRLMACYNQPSDATEFVCQQCLEHVSIRHTQPSHSCSGHFYLITSTGHSVSGCCIHCSKALLVNYSSRVLPHALLNNVLDGKDTAEQSDTLFMLVFYVMNRLHNGKSINMYNPQFRNRVGVSLARYYI